MVLLLKPTLCSVKTIKAAIFETSQRADLNYCELLSPCLIETHGVSLCTGKDSLASCWTVKDDYLK